MMIKRLALVIVASCLIIPLIAQRTAIYTEANEAYKQGRELYDSNVFGKARDEFLNAIRMLRPANEPQAILLRTKAELYYAKSAVQLGLPDGEKLILEFIRKYSPDPIADQALLELADFYYIDKEYEKALAYYEKIPLSGLTREDRTRVLFRRGYSNFVQKKFTEAKRSFREIKDIRGEYYESSNYYLGLCHFYEGEYDAAIAAFNVAERSKDYEGYIPFYNCQIYFAERRFEELINYAEPRLRQRGLRKEKEIRQLVGQSYFELGNYERALPHLEYYAERSGSLREEEFYQLGYAHYQTGKYQKAVRSFEELASVKSELGQFAMYYLADCYLKLELKGKAQTAFALASRMDYNPAIQEESTFNYAKLAYEMRNGSQAIAALKTFTPESRYYTEAQDLMAEIFLNYRDYQQAITVITTMYPERRDRTPKIREALQKVTYLRALQLLQADDLEGAKTRLAQSLEDPVDSRTRALAIYWQGDIAYREEQYNQCIRLMNQFLTLARTLDNLPDESSVFTANYLLGYCYLRQENFTGALDFFEEAVAGIRRNRAFIGNPDITNQILGDAVMRAGDCQFKRNRYDQAIAYYDQAVDQRYPGYVYALYQKAIIEGLRNRITEKILALESLARRFPDSPFADDALLQLGVTYQEIGQLSKAAEPLRTLVADFGNRSELLNQALLRLGLISYNQGNLQMAIDYYKQVFSNNPEPSEANIALTALEEIYVSDLGRADDYFAFLETIPGYNVDNFARDSINFRAAEVQYENANYERAVQAYTDYIRKFQQGAYLLQAHYHRGESNSVLKRYGEALLDYEYVVRQGQSRFYLKALEKAALIAYNYEQDFDKAYELYSQMETAAASAEQRFDAQLGALRSAYRTGNTNAVYELARKVGTNPAASQQQMATANFYLGKVAFDQQDYQNALSAFEDVIRLSNNEQTAEARFLTAYIYYLRRDLERAQEICINANRESSGYPYWVAKCIILLSDILAEKGDLISARAALEALLENYDEDREIVNTARDKLDRLDTQINNTSRLSTERSGEFLEMEEGGGN